MKTKGPGHRENPTRFRPEILLRFRPLPPVYNGGDNTQRVQARQPATAAPNHAPRCGGRSSPTRGAWRLHGLWRGCEGREAGSGEPTGSSSEREQRLRAVCVAGWVGGWLAGLAGWVGGWVRGRDTYLTYKIFLLVQLYCVATCVPKLQL